MQIGGKGDVTYPCEKLWFVFELWYRGRKEGLLFPRVSDCDAAAAMRPDKKSSDR